jgi:acyl-CoA hydrolase
MNTIEKRVKDSYSEQVQVLTQANINGYNRLFGGQLMEWIDVVAAVVARRHSNRNVTTAVVDTLTFQAPAHANDTVIICGHITYVRRTSMEVCIKSYVERLDGSRKLINTAYIVMVALDENEKPVEVPRLILETDEEKTEWEAAQKRYDLRKQRRNEHF